MPNGTEEAVEKLDSPRQLALGRGERKKRERRGKERIVTRPVLRLLNSPAHLKRKGASRVLAPSIVKKKRKERGKARAPYRPRFLRVVRGLERGDGAPGLRGTRKRKREKKSGFPANSLFPLC